MVHGTSLVDLRQGGSSKKVGAPGSFDKPADLFYNPTSQFPHDPQSAGPIHAKRAATLERASEHYRRRKYG